VTEVEEASKTIKIVPRDTVAFRRISELHSHFNNEAHVEIRPNRLVFKTCGENRVTLLKTTMRTGFFSTYTNKNHVETLIQDLESMNDIIGNAIQGDTVTLTYRENEERGSIHVDKNNSLSNQYTSEQREGSFGDYEGLRFKFSQTQEGEDDNFPSADTVRIRIGREEFHQLVKNLSTEHACFDLYTKNDSHSGFMLNIDKKLDDSESVGTLMSSEVFVVDGNEHLNKPPKGKYSKQYFGRITRLKASVHEYLISWSDNHPSTFLASGNGFNTKMIVAPRVSED